MTTSTVSSRRITGNNDIDDIEPSSTKADTRADVYRNALQIFSKTLFKVKHAFSCSIAHYDVDWGGSLSPSMDIWGLMVYQVARSGFIGRFMCQLGVSWSVKFFFFFFFSLWCFYDGITWRISMGFYCTCTPEGQSSSSSPRGGVRSTSYLG